MQVEARHPGRVVTIRGGILALSLISLSACHTTVAVRASTRAIAEAAEAPSPPDRHLALQFSVETPSAAACQRVSAALPQRAKAYGLAPANIKCVDSATGHDVEFAADVPVVVTPNKSGVVKAPMPEHVLFRAFVATFSHVMRERRMGTGYAVTLLYNRRLFAALQAELAKEDPRQDLMLPDVHLSLDLVNDLRTNEVAQVTSAFVAGEPVVHSKAYTLAPDQSINAIFSDVSVADFGQSHFITLASFYPAD